MIWVYPHDLEHLHIDFQYISLRLISSTPYAWLHWLPKLDCYLEQLTAGSFSGPAWSSTGTSPSWPNPILSKKGIQNNSGDLWCANFNFSSTSSTYQLHNTLHELFLGNFSFQEFPKLAVAWDWLKINLKGKLDISWQETWLLKYTKPQKGFRQDSIYHHFWNRILPKSTFVVVLKQPTAAKSWLAAQLADQWHCRFVQIVVLAETTIWTKGKGSIDSNKVMGV